MDGPQSSSIPSDLVGREEDIEIIKKFLLDEKRLETNLTVLPVVGMKGVGKTALAQHLYNDEDILKTFKHKGWVCAAENLAKNFELAKLTRAIIVSVTERPCGLNELSALQNKLKQELEGKRYLLVLDHVWNEDQDLWRRLRGPLASGAEGSVVVVTTQSFTVAEIIGTMESPYVLECLSEKDSWSLFAKHAFEGRNLKEHLNLVYIGQRIAGKCQGLLSALMELGVHLRYTSDEETWNDTLQRATQDLDDRGDVLDVKLHHLPADLKGCVAYCSLFPKGYLFHQDQLIRLWMAQGFIQSQERKQLEDIGTEYLKKLSFRSLFQPSQTEEEGIEMHNIDHDLLSESISGKECSRVEDANLCCFSPEARHLSFVPHNVESVVQFQSYKPSALRTFLILKASQHASNVILRVQGLEGMFLNLNILRALDLSFTGIDKLPDSIGNLKHLRYLGLNGTRIKRLPESICGLFHLQTLELKECGNLQELPKSMKNLINLRHLDFDIHASFSLPAGIENLTNLRTLPRFNVGRDNGHCRIRELKALVNLGGELCISGLCDAISVEDAMEANLKYKPYLDKLTLIWLRDKDAENLHMGTQEPVLDAKSAKEEKMLESLQPHTNLTQLIIQSYGGVRFPWWVGDSSFSKLKVLSLEDFAKLATLPTLPSLLHLELCACSALTGLPAFSSLQTLKLRANKHLITISSLSSLCKLDLWACRGLTALLDLPSLDCLNVIYCEALTSLPTFPKLQHLTVIHCSALASLSTLPVLEELLIEDCEQLTSIGLWDSSSTGLPHPTSSLKTLRIVNCPQLHFLPDEQLPTTLNYLYIDGCPSIGDWCRKHKDTKLAHISYVFIDGRQED